MIYQNNKDLDEHIIKYGCYFMSLLFIVQVENKKVWSVSDINKFYDRCVHKKWCDKDCYIEDPISIMNDCLLLKSCSQNGQVKNGQFAWWGRHEYNWTIIENRSLRRNKHFTCGDANFEEFHNPLPGSEKTFTPDGRYILYFID